MTRSIHDSAFQASTPGRIIGYLPKFLAFTYREFPLARLTLVLTLFSVALEYATLSLMIPLARGVDSISGLSRTIVDFWSSVASLGGFPLSSQTWLWMFLIFLALRIAVGYGQVTLSIYVSKRIHAHLSDKVFNRVVTQEPLSRIFQKTIGYYVFLAGDETHKAGSIFFFVGQLLASALSAAAGLAVLFSFSQTVFWLTIAFIVICALLLLRGMGVILRLSSESLDLSRALNTVFIEAMNGLRSIRSLSAEKYVIHGYRTQIRRYVECLFRIDALNQAFKALPAIILIGLGIIWLWPGELQEQSATTLFFFAITTMLIRILAALGEFVTAGGRMVADIRASHGAGELLNQGVELSGVLKKELLGDEIAHVTLRQVSCGYGDNVVLTDISGDLVRGKAYAIIGESGSGKSTLADVLLGLLPILSGQICINGRKLESIDPGSLRSRVILVEQQTRIFTGPVRDNVTMGLKASDEQVWTALWSVGLGEFVEGLPLRTDAVLDYQGANLSGGQRQRIGIARALIRQPDMLILDEGTSAVDPAMKATLVAGLRKQFSDRILVFITHDKEVQSVVDEIWRLRDGALVRESTQGFSLSLDGFVGQQT